MKIVLLTGLTSSGKDTLLAQAFERELAVPCFSKCTTRGQYKSERASGAASSDRPYREIYMTNEQLSHECVAIYERYHNWYGISRNELEKWQDLPVIAGIYSGIDRLEHAKKELTEFGEVRVVLRWAPLEVVLERLAEREFPLVTEKAKRRQAKEDAVTVEKLKKQGFFDAEIKEFERIAEATSDFLDLSDWHVGGRKQSTGTTSARSSDATLSTT